MASDAIDIAVQSRLSGDGTLSALLTGGVYNAYDFYMGDSTSFPVPFAVVTLFTGKDVRELRGRGWEECRYVVTVHTETDGPQVPLSTIRQACARIDELLHGATFSISGYTLLKSERERRYFGGMQFDEFEHEDYFQGAYYGGLYAIWARAN
jgi:hypothetical protein